MFHRCLPILILFAWSSRLSAQDSSYVRKVLKHLCSPECYGRGYLKNGLTHAETYLLNEIKKSGALPLFSEGYTQKFYHGVNTFPSAMRVKLNGVLLEPGRDFIPQPGAMGAKGHALLYKTDSTHFSGLIGTQIIRLAVKKKLTYSVANKVNNACELDMLPLTVLRDTNTVEIKMKNKFVKHFISKNIGCMIKGTGKSDSCLVFTAHYDHLGGLGKSCYFPGANDNASGVSMVLSFLNYYVSHPSKYSCVFVFFAGEEAGLLGSKYFVESGCMDLHKIKFLINLDLLGTGDDGIMVVNGAVHEKIFDKLTGINAQKQLVTQIKKRGKAANSDHYWFSEAGVPCFFVYTMGGISAYHDINDKESTLPLTAYRSVFTLLTNFMETF